MAIPMLAALAMLALAAPASADEYVVGGDFEGGTPVIEMEGGEVVGEGIDHPNWQESDDQFTSPICSTTLGECTGPIVPYGPRGGQAWALFGAYPGIEAHTQTLSQTMTLPAVEKAALSFYVWVGEFEREASLSVIFDQKKVQAFEEPELPAPSGNPAFQQVAVPIAGGGTIEAGQHTVALQYISDSVTGLEPKPTTTLSVDDVSFTATPIPVIGPLAPVIPPPAIDTKIKKVQLYTAKAGKTGSPKVPRRPSLYKATQGKTGKPAKAKFFFEGSGGEGPHTFRCQLDDGAFRPCTSPIFYKKLKLGQHTFKVFAVDRAGNRDETPATYVFKAKAGKSGRAR